MDKRDEVERLLADIQFDRWIFGFPRKFTVVSHGHKDHDPVRKRNGLEFNFPEPLIFGERYARRWAQYYRNVKGVATFPRHYSVEDGCSIRVEGVKVTCLGPNTVAKYAGVKEKILLHADWWFIATKKVLILFVGELDVSELPFLKRILHSPQIDAVILPSYGKINPPRHGVTKPEELMEGVKEVATATIGESKLVYALPHPVFPSWAHKSAMRKGEDWMDTKIP